MNANERLQRGRAAAIEGRYEEALTDYEWFHENALADDPALRGVRRSFALADWAELGLQFPRAREALLAVRDRKRDELLNQVEDDGLFADVVAINHYLEDEVATYQLFLTLHKSAPNFARKCFCTALPAVVGAEDYELARSYIPNPEASVASLLEDFNESVERANALPDKRRRKSRLEAYTSNFSADVQLLLEIVRHTDGVVRSTELYRAAMAGLPTDALRKRVSRKLDA